jgi:AbrB family looped-hinge helix DNA binding protein
MAVASTVLSRRGQVVLPKAIREELALKEGDTLMCAVKDGRIVMAPLNTAARAKAFEDFIAWGRQFAKDNKLTRRMVARAVREVRYGKS